MLTKQVQIMAGQPLKGSISGTTWTSQPIPWGEEPGWIMVIRTGGSFTGTTPSIVPELDLNDNGGGYTRVGGAISAISAAGLVVVPYFTGTTQGAVVSSYSNTHTYTMQVKLTLNNADNVFPQVWIDLIALQ